jgi:hypothetical protein
MRYLRQLCLIATLVLTFTFPVYAGEIECPGVTAASNNVGSTDDPANNLLGNTVPNSISETAILLILALI